MNVGLLLVTHDGIGTAYRKIIHTLLRQVPADLQVLEVPLDCSLEHLTGRCQNFLDTIDQGDGVLILTDLYGSTPCNVAIQASTGHNVRVVSGLNFPMLIRVLNYPQLPLGPLAEKALTGGKDGIVHNTTQ